MTSLDMRAIYLPLIFVLCLNGTVVWASESKSLTLTMGVVPQFDSRRLRAVWEPILEAVGGYASVEIQLVGSPNIPVFEKQFMAGQFDLLYLNPYHMIEAHRTQGYQPILRDVGRLLHGIVVVRKDSPVKTIQELNGGLIAFPAPNAFAASLMPRAEFEQVHGLTFTPWYVNSHSSVYLNVMLGRVVAGGGVQKTLSKQPLEVRTNIRIIYRTSDVVPHPLAVHPRLPTSLRTQIQNAFLALGETPAGQALLGNIPVHKIGVASLQDYEPLKVMHLDQYYVKE